MMRKVLNCKRRGYGVQIKILTYSLGLLGATMLVLCVILAVTSAKSVMEATVQNHCLLNDKMEAVISTVYDEINKATEDWILDQEVQNSLKRAHLRQDDQNTIILHLTYLSGRNIENVVYIDNKGIQYTRQMKNAVVSADALKSIDAKLGDAYSRTKLFGMNDSVFGTETERLFAARRVRDMDYSHDYGIIIYTVTPDLFDAMLRENPHAGEVEIGLLDDTGRVIFCNKEQGLKQTEKFREIRKENTGQSIFNVEGGAVILNFEKSSGFTVYTYIPQSVLVRDTVKMVRIIIITYVLLALLAVGLSICFAKKFTDPIIEISEVMQNFDGTSFSPLLSLDTNTELDTIGQSYNKMLEFTEELIGQIRHREEELRKNELNLLMEQIHPHFLYNTLDNIYMMARVSREETMMKLIQALSQYLKISLSKGESIISVEEELIHAGSYMDIMKVRNENLFEYEIYCDVDRRHTRIMKILLQPLVENAIKHGFANIYEGGLIQIFLKYVNGFLEVRVRNSGESLTPEQIRKINQMCGMPLDEVNKVFDQSGSGYGIGNIVSRLRLMYGDRVEFCFLKMSEGAECVIKIPKEATLES